MHTITQGNYNILTESVFLLKKGDKTAFESIALQCFALQYQNNPVYRQFTDALRLNPEVIKTSSQIPFLPIEIFKTQKVVTETNISNNLTVFTSSGTTDTGTSHHYVNDIALYEKSFLKSFELFYGNPEGYCVLALLPSYLERSSSSLVYMAQKLIELSKSKESGFYLNNLDELEKTISLVKEKKWKTILLGVSYALLDLIERGIT